MKRLSGFLVLGAFLFFVLVAFTSRLLWQAYSASGEQSLGLSAYVLWIIATGVLIVWFALLALRLHRSSISPKVLAALSHALKDDDYRVRSKAAVGLSELDMEESSHYYEHNQLDDILISALKDDDYRVRSKVVEGLTEVELEQFTHHKHNQLEAEGLTEEELEQLTHHKHNQLENALLEDMARAFK